MKTPKKDTHRAFWIPMKNGTYQLAYPVEYLEELQEEVIDNEIQKLTIKYTELFRLILFTYPSIKAFADNIGSTTKTQYKKLKGLSAFRVKDIIKYSEALRVSAEEIIEMIK